MDGSFAGSSLGKLFLLLVVAATYMLYIALQRCTPSENPLRRYLDRHGVWNVGAWLSVGLVAAGVTYLLLFYS